VVGESGGLESVDESLRLETPKQFPNSSSLNFNKLMKEASSQEFFDALDGASAEDLELMLSSAELELPRNTLAMKVKNGWRRLMAVPAEPRSVFSILCWWESRRLFYNIVVGSVGIFMAALACLHLQLSGGLLILVLLTCAAWAIAGNICYTMGLLAELIARLFKKSGRYGPILFAMGLTFSIIVVISYGLSLLFD
jgi:hypothetical protein